MIYKIIQALSDNTFSFLFVIHSSQRSGLTGFTQCDKALSSSAVLNKPTTYNDL